MQPSCHTETCELIVDQKHTIRTRHLCHTGWAEYTERNLTIILKICNVAINSIRAEKSKTNGENVSYARIHAILRRFVVDRRSSERFILHFPVGTPARISNTSSDYGVWYTEWVPCPLHEAWRGTAGSMHQAMRFACLLHHALYFFPMKSLPLVPDACVFNVMSDTVRGQYLPARAGVPSDG
jgi:hypothetical protein